jgi:adenylate kinase family enzyme
MVVCLRCTPQTVLARIQADTGGDRSGRTDDDLEAVRRKLAIYSGRTEPLLAYYRSAGARTIFLDVTSTMTAEKMWEGLLGHAVSPAANTSPTGA